jgi:hypothetical protein
VSRRLLSDFFLRFFCRRSMKGAAVAALSVLAVAAVGCSHNAESSKPLASDARLHELGLKRGVPAQVAKACAEARRLASVRVICPRLIPDVPLLKIEGLWGSIVLQDEPRFYMLSFNNGGLGRARHWLTGGGNAAVVKEWVLTDKANEVEGDPKLVRAVDVDRRRVLIYRFPPFPAGGPNGGHWAAFVRVGDQLVFASLHGRRYVDAAVEMALDLAQLAERSHR